MNNNEIVLTFVSLFFAGGVIGLMAVISGAFKRKDDDK